MPSQKPMIPDGGYGWVVVCGSLVISVIADGISFVFGLLYIEFLDYFNESKATTAWIGSLFLAVPLISGPICSALVDRFGCRWMTIMGGLVSGLGFVASAFVDSIGAMYVTFGIISGLGLGLCYVTAVVSIAYWFDKKRTLATSVGACGTGIGTFIYAPLTRMAISYYGWRGTVLLLAGTLFNMCVCGSLMRDPEWWIDAQRSRASSICQDLDELKRMLETGTNLPISHISSVNDQSYHSLVNLPTYVRSTDKVPQEVVEQLLGREQALRLAGAGNPLDRVKGRSASTSGRLNSFSESGSPIRDIDGTQNHDIQKHRPASKSLANHLRSIRVYRNSVMYRGAILNTHKYRLKASSCPDIFKNSMTTIAKEETWLDEVLDLLKDMVDFSMFGDLHFLLMSISQILLFMWFIVPYFYLAEHMVSKGFTEDQASIVLSIIGISSTFGMLVMGWAGDQPWMNVTKTYACCLIATGLFTLAMPFVSGEFLPLTLISAGFGIFVSSNFSFTPTILVELIPLDQFTTAYGLTLLCQGIGTLIGPPLAGGLYDLTYSWELSFFMAGGWIIIAGVLMMIIPMTNTVRLWHSDIPSCAESVA